MNTNQYLIADSKAHIAALLRITDEAARQRLLKAIRMNKARRHTDKKDK